MNNTNTNTTNNNQTSNFIFSKNRNSLKQCKPMMNKTYSFQYRCHDITENRNNYNNTIPTTQPSKGQKRQRVTEGEDDKEIISALQPPRRRLNQYARFDSRNLFLQPLRNKPNDVNLNSSNENNTTNNNGGACYIDRVPKEIFFKIISFIGPASSSLIALMQINKRYSSITNEVAVAILERAKSRSYRSLLPHLYKNESLMVQCVRHIRCFQDIMNKFHQLKSILDKDFVRGCLIDALTRGCITLPTIQEINRATSKRGREGGEGEVDEGDDEFDYNNNASESSSTGSNSYSPVTPIEIDKALDIALDLLGADSVTYFLSNRTHISIDQLHPDFFGLSGTNEGSNSNSPNSNSDGRKNILSYFTEEIENQILSLCGKCGGKIFKYIKMMSLFSNYHALVLEENGVLRSPPSPLAPGTVQLWKDEERMDRARLIMQLVVHRLLIMEPSCSNI